MEQLGLGQLKKSAERFFFYVDVHGDLQAEEPVISDSNLRLEMQDYLCLQTTERIGVVHAGH